jgi:hypothetical protein
MGGKPFVGPGVGFGEHEPNHHQHMQNSSSSSGGSRSSGRSSSSASSSTKDTLTMKYTCYMYLPLQGLEQAVALA